MIFQPKQGYVLAELVDAGIKLEDGFASFKIVHAAPADIGVVVFIPVGASIHFSENLHLIKIEDVLVFIKPEVPASDVSVEAAA